MKTESNFFKTWPRGHIFASPSILQTPKVNKILRKNIDKKISTSNFSLLHKIQYHSRFLTRHTYTRAKFAMEGSIMTISDALVTVMFGVALPTWDVSSDIFLCFTFLTPMCNDYEPYQYYEKHLNWSRKYIIFRHIYIG